MWPAKRSFVIWSVVFLKHLILKQIIANFFCLMQDNDAQSRNIDQKIINNHISV